MRRTICEESRLILSILLTFETARCTEFDIEFWILEYRIRQEISSFLCVIIRLKLDTAVSWNLILTLRHRIDHPSAFPLYE